MKNILEYWIVEELMKDDSSEEEGDGSGCLVLLVPLLIIGVILLILNKVGISPIEVWTFIKIVSFPSTWDWQLDKNYSHLRAGLMMVLSFAGTLSVTFVIGYVNDLFLNSIKKITLFPIRILHLLLDIVDRILIYILIFNTIFIGIRAAFHIIWGSIVWLAN